MEFNPSKLLEEASQKAQALLKMASEDLQDLKRPTRSVSAETVEAGILAHDRLIDAVQQTLDNLQTAKENSEAGGDVQPRIGSGESH